MRLALFPLSAHLLPGGVMPLRIFEPRYERMIAEAGESGFALCMLDSRQPDAARNMFPIATRVTIIDFDRLPDGMLGITVQGEERVQIDDLWQESDGLRIGVVTPLPLWPPCRIQPDQWPLVTALQDVFTDFPDYAALYPHPCWDDGNWAALRWLEILPIPAEQKQLLLAAIDNQPAMTLLKGVLVASH
ncbi:MAG: LON peptidase substrate-binding domain-containing protein [Aeromonas sp.]